MPYYKLQPEVPGELHRQTTLDRSTRPPKAINLKVLFLGWMGDDLLDIFPCFFVTDQLKVCIEINGLTGCSFETFELEIGEDAPPETSNTKFWRMVPSLWEQLADIRVNPKGYLVVSELALLVINKHKIECCDVLAVQQDGIPPYPRSAG